MVNKFLVDVLSWWMSVLVVVRESIDEREALFYTHETWKCAPRQQG